MRTGTKQVFVSKGYFGFILFISIYICLGSLQFPFPTECDFQLNLIDSITLIGIISQERLAGEVARHVLFKYLNSR